jgi:hypothetical protein
MKELTAKEAEGEVPSRWLDQGEHPVGEEVLQDRKFDLIFEVPMNTCD